MQRYRKESDMEDLRLGNALTDGLTYEMYGTNSSRSKFKAAVVYLGLNGYLNRETMKNIRFLIEEDAKARLPEDVMFDNISEMLLHDLKQSFSFESFLDLQGELDSMVIPNWLSANADQLFRLIPDVCFMKDHLYYIKHQGNEDLFCRVPKESRKIFGDGKDMTDQLKKKGEDDPIVISDKYSEIISSDKDKGIIYLRFRSVKNMYSKYMTENENEVIVHNGLIGVTKEGSLVLCDKGCLRIKKDENEVIIKQNGAYDDYQIKDDELLVRPKRRFPLFFEPYRVLEDGTIKEASYKEKLEFLLDIIRKDLMLRISLRDAVNMFKQDDNSYRLTVDTLEKLLVKSSNTLVPDKNELFFKLIDLLGERKDPDEDILSLLYDLVDISKRYGSKSYSFIICKEFIDGCRGIDISADLKEELYKKIYWTQLKIDALIDTALMHENKKIGHFSFAKEHMEKKIISVDKAVSYGNILIDHETTSMEGIVAFDVANDKHVIISNKELSKVQILLIKKEFDIKDSDYEIVING